MSTDTRVQMIQVCIEEASAHYEIKVPSSQGDWVWRIEATDAECSCPAFKYSGAKRSCKHATRVNVECNWVQGDDERQTGRMRQLLICPRCQGKTAWQRVMSN